MRGGAIFAKCFPLLVLFFFKVGAASFNLLEPFVHVVAADVLFIGTKYAVDVCIYKGVATCGKAVYVNLRKVDVKPFVARIGALVTAANERHRKRSALLVALHCLSNCTVGKVAVVANPGGYCNKAGCQPVIWR